jgi:hypothetical protein
LILHRHNHSSFYWGLSDAEPLSELIWSPFDWWGNCSLRENFNLYSLRKKSNLPSSITSEYSEFLPRTLPTYKELICSLC